MRPMTLREYRRRTGKVTAADVMPPDQMVTFYSRHLAAQIVRSEIKLRELEQAKRKGMRR